MMRRGGETSTRFQILAVATPRGVQKMINETAPDISTKFQDTEDIWLGQPLSDDQSI